MLQSNVQNERTQLLQSGAMPGEQREENGIGELLNFAFGFLRRQYLLIILAGALGLTASVIYLRITPAAYTAQVKVLLGNPKAQFVQQQSVVAEAPVDVAQIESQIQILTSKATATSVIDKLKLADDPDFQNSDESAHSVWQIVREWFGLPPPERQADTMDRLVGEFDRRLTATRSGYSRVIEVGFNASRAERAAEIANAVAETYVADQVNEKSNANRAATAWLHDRLTELGHDALVAEQKVNELKASNNIVTVTGDGKNLDDQQVNDLNSRLVAARAQTSEVLARMNRYQTVLASNSADSIGKLDAPGSDALSSSIITSLRQQYLEYARREYEYSMRYGSDHLAVINIRTAMKAIRQSILDEVRRLAESSRSDFEVAKQHQQEIEKQLAMAVSRSRNTSSAELSIRELETSAKGYRSLYETFLQRYMGSLQQESFPIAEARVISPATPPLSKSKPKTTMILALGTLAGIALGATLGLIRDIMDRAIRTSAQVEATLRLPCLSLVPLVGRREKRRLSQYFDCKAGQRPAERMLSRSREVYWAATAMPLSRFAESIRSIRLAVDLDATRTSNKIVGITSTLPNEGKSTIAAALAQLVSHAGKRVIVVDCDLRNPSLSATLTPRARTGIVEVLAGTSSLEEAVWSDPRMSLTFLPVANKGPLLHTSELLSTEQTKRLFDKLRASYDCIIVDLPPLAPIIDARATAPLVDRFILVVEWGRTTTEVVQHALHAAPDVYEALIGTVLNKTDMTAMKRYASYYGDYYNKIYHDRYNRLAAE